MSDDLDDLLRRAMKTLDDRVPPGYFEDFANQTLARLEDSMPDERKEVTDAAAATNAPAATAAPAPAAPIVPASATADEPAAKRDEDSGLHDIRSLASSQRMRMVAKRTSQHPIVRDDDLLASASGSWKSIALPEPAKMVSLPELSELPTTREVKEAEARDSKARLERVEGAPAEKVEKTAKAAAAAAAPAKAATAAAVEAPSKREAATVTPIEKAKAKPAAAPAAKGSKKNAALIAGSLAAVAAAGVVMVISSKDKAPQQAAAPAPAARQELALPELRSAQPAPAPTVSAIEPAAAPAPEVKPPEAPADTVAKPAPAIEKPSKSAGKYVPNVVDEPKPVEKTKAPEPKKGDPGDPDFDKLLKEAGYQDKKAEAPKLEKKSLSGDDIKKGMNAVAGKVTACYQGTEGSAAVRLTVAPSGQVQKVTISGVFAGTPVGSCVEAAVQGVSFPAWDGGPQTVSYSYLLSE